MSERKQVKIGNISIPSEFEKGYTFVVKQKGDERGNIFAIEFGAKKKTDAEKLITVNKNKALRQKVSNYKNSLRAKISSIKTRNDSLYKDGSVTMEQMSELMSAESKLKETLLMSKNEILELLN